jgi:quercetin dioxygenase-like cupin family protein
MKHHLKYILPLVIIFFFAACHDNQKTEDAKQQHTLVFPQGERIANENFTGTAYLQGLIDADSLNSISVGNVTFEPGARSKWHSHPAGQILLVTDGVGYYQEKGQIKKLLRKGDAIKCPPNIPHWHGASADTAFVQIAITSREDGPTVWLEEVTDEEYNSDVNPNQ